MATLLRTFSSSPQTPIFHHYVPRNSQPDMANGVVLWDSSANLQDILNSNSSSNTADSGQTSDDSSTATQDALPRAFYAIMIIIGIIVESIVVSELVEKLYEKYLQRLAEKHRAEKAIMLLKDQSTRQPVNSQQADIVRDAAPRQRKNALSRRVSKASIEQQTDRNRLAEEIIAEDGIINLHQDQQKNNNNNNNNNAQPGSHNNAQPSTADTANSSSVALQMTPFSPVSNATGFEGSSSSSGTVDVRASALSTTSNVNNAVYADNRRKAKDLSQRFAYPDRVVLNDTSPDDFLPGPSAMSSTSTKTQQIQLNRARDLGGIKPPASGAPGTVTIGQSRTTGASSYNHNNTSQKQDGEGTKSKSRTSTNGGKPEPQNVGLKIHQPSKK